MQWQIEMSENFIITSLKSEEPVLLTTMNCAWCNDEAGIPQGEGSHGICDWHAEQQYNALKLRVHKFSLTTIKS